MKKTIFLFLSLWIGFSAFAQEDGLKVESFRDVSAQKQYARRADTPTDNNGEKAALVLVQVLDSSNVSVSFSDSYKLNVDVKFVNNEYWVYMAAGASKLEISHQRYPKISVNFKEASGSQIGKLASQCTYELVISVPITEKDTVLIAESYEDRVKAAREMYNGWRNTTDPEYFLKARKVYEALMAHENCPKEAIPVYQKEYDDMRFMRKYTALCHKAWNIAEKWEKKAGYAHDSVYHWLIMAVKQTDKLVKKYPGGSFEKLQSEAIAKRNQHPKANESYIDKTQEERNSARGIVTQKVEYLPYNSIGIYATKVEKPKKDDEKQRIGTVRSDRTYEVVMPDGFSYIIFDGEKEGHLVYTSNQEINIFIK